jgi:hypothetical protein
MWFFPNKAVSYAKALEAGDTKSEHLKAWVEGWHFPEDLPAALAEYARAVELKEFLGLEEADYKRLLEEDGE